jgi:hypothetical protein
MLINSPNISGSLTVTGNSVITGSLTVLGGINAAITGSATTASYVEYSNIANKPTLVSGSEQVSFNGIVDKPTLVSGSSQVTYSGLTGIPAGIVSGSSQISFNGITDKPTLVSGSEQVSFNGIVDKPTLVSGSSQVTYSGLSSIPSGIVSSSAQVGGYGIFATTGSNQFNGSQSITGSLTVTGQVVAQTLNVQQVTSSIVFSSGSNIFGNSLANTQQFTGSVSVTGSLAVTSSMSIAGDGSNDMFKAVRSGVTRVVIKNGVNTLGINTDTINNPLTVNGGADFSGNVGIGTATPDKRLHLSASNDAASVRFTNQAASKVWDLTPALSGIANSGFSVYNVTDNLTPFHITDNGNVGIGVTDMGPNGLSLPTGFNYSWSEGSGNAYAVLFRQRNSAATVVASGYKRSDTGAFASSYGISMARAAIAVGSNNGSIAFFSDAATNVANGTDIAPTERLTILNNGNVGVSETNPSSMLHFSKQTTWGSTDNRIININNTGTGGDINVAHNMGSITWYSGNSTPTAEIAAYRNTPASGNNIELRFYTANAGTPGERMRLTSNGSLLMGTTSTTNTSTGRIINRTSGTSDPNSTLNNGAWSNASIGVEPALYLSSNVVAATGAGGSSQTAKGGIGFEYYSPTSPTELSVGIFGTPTVASNLRFWNESERMRITSGGNVLIGTTTNLGSELNVNNTIRVGVAFGSQASIIFGDSGTPYWNVGRPAGSGNFVISSYALTALTIAPTTGNATFAGSVDITSGLTVTNQLRGLIGTFASGGSVTLNITTAGNPAARLFLMHAYNSANANINLARLIMVNTRNLAVGGGNSIAVISTTHNSTGVGSEISTLTQSIGGSGATIDLIISGTTVNGTGNITVSIQEITRI